ncbi:MAG: translation initiation factor 2 [Oscillospiraceae bacterium]|nr:translation initiation factor 2 [Oscillospiraceae bacterium]
MVKGINRRVIVVKSPDPRYFDEAIFIVKEDVNLTGVDTKRVLEEAETVAKGYVKQQAYRRGILAKIPPLGYLAMGAFLTVAMMALTGLLI